MLAECNIDISPIVFYIELLFLAYIEETKLLAKFLFLDKLDKLQEVSPLKLLEG